MSGYTTDPDAVHIDIHVPFTLLAIDPSLQGICLWGQRTGAAEPYIEWLVNVVNARSAQRSVQRSVQRSAQRSVRRFGQRPVRMPANATPASVTLPVGREHSGNASVAGGRRGTVDAAEVDGLIQTTGALLQRARGGVLIIESADLVSRPTAAALVRALARMPIDERPVLIARSEEHPSLWPLIAQQCAFWVREPRPVAPWSFGQVAFGGKAAVIDDDATTIDIRDVITAASTLQNIELTPDALQQIMSRIDLHGGTVPANIHGVDLFVARAAKALAALNDASKIRSEHIETASQLIAAPRFSDGESVEQSTSEPDPGAVAEPDTSDTNTSSSHGLPPLSDSPTNPAPATPGTDGEPDEESGRESNERTTSGMSAHTAERQSESSVPANGTGPPGSHAPDGVAGGDASRVIVVPPAALFAALTLPAADLDRPAHAPRARLGATGTPAGVAPGYALGHPVALGATLQAAIPWQRLRRPRPGASSAPVVQIRPDDLRSHRRRPRPKVLYIIAVDGSGSMAQGRMQLAKSAALAVLAGAYRERRFVSLIDFRGDQATLVCPPGRSSAQIRRLITAMPSGGGTPLPAALALARDVARRWLHTNPIGTVNVIMFTDGKANVPLRAKATQPVGEYNAAPTDESRASSASRRAVARRDIVEIAEQLSTMPVTISLVDNHSWRPTPELHDLAHMLNAPIVRVSHRRLPR